MWKGNFFVLLVSLSLLVPSVSLVAQPDQLLSQATSISSQLRGALNDSQNYLDELATRSNLLQERLSASESLLETQAGELLSLSDYLTSTMNSFNLLSAELQTSTILLHEEMMRRQRMQRTLAIIGIIGGLIILCKGAMLVLYYGRGIRFPTWVKIIV